jgi:hypothetical protein
MSNVDGLRFALELIGTECTGFTSGWTCVDAGGRSPYAAYGAERWCDHCIARTAIKGGPFPDWGTSGVEELPLDELPDGVTVAPGRFWWQHHRQFGDRSRVCGPTPGTSGHPSTDCVGCGVRELDWFRGEPIAKSTSSVVAR